MGLFTRFRSEEAAAAAIGRVEQYEGTYWQCVGHNDLGCLYWRKVRNGLPFGKTYVLPGLR